VLLTLFARMLKGFALVGSVCSSTSCEPPRGLSLLVVLHGELLLRYVPRPPLQLWALLPTVVECAGEDSGGTVVTVVARGRALRSEPRLQGEAAARRAPK